MNRRHSKLQRLLAQALIYTVGLSPMASSYASIDIDDIPLVVKQQPKPNLIFVYDDSGSMDFEVLFVTNDGAGWYYTAGKARSGGTVDGLATPGFTGLGSDGFTDFQQSGTINFNISGGSSGTWKKYAYLFPNGTCGGSCDTRSYSDGSSDHFAVAPTAQFAWFRSPDYNKQYYNPAVRYGPWQSYNDGTASCPSGSATGSAASYLCTPKNAAPDKARSHPIYGTSTMDLKNKVGTNKTNNFTFRMYPGMVIPKGAEYRECKGTGTGSTCDSWTSASDELCIESDCPAGTYTGFTPRSGSYGKNDYDHAEAAIEYWPATVYISENNPNYAAYDVAKYPINALKGTEVKGPDGKRLRLVEINSNNTSYPKGADRDDCGGSTCTFEEELQNFANWFQYYRKRHQSMAAAFGNALDEARSLRTGYFLFNSLTPVTMYDVDTTDTRANARFIMGMLYKVKGNSGTPTRTALDYAGQQFRRTGSGAPVQAECQFNAGFVITDGFANSSKTSPGNVDGDTSNVYNYQFNPDPAVKIADPFRDSYADTLADVAMKYYANKDMASYPSLRPDLEKSEGRMSIEENDLSPGADRNDRLHMVTYGLGLGVRGLVYANPAFVAVNADPYTNPIKWDDFPNPVTSQRGPINIDELWHATINGRGRMLNADSPEETRAAILDVVREVQGKSRAASSVAVSNANPVKGDNFAYSSAFRSGAWSGDLNKFELDLTTGQIIENPLWAPSPQAQLAARTPSTRLIATYDGVAGKAFQWVSLSAAQQTALNGSAGDGQDVLSYLRGDRSKEGDFYRSRGQQAGLVSVLGDIVNGEPVVVGPPRLFYFDTGYSSFKSAQASRQTVVYQGANDGMLHAFDATSGAELWAYVPNRVFPTLRNLSDKDFFKHLYYIDGTPTTADVNMNNTIGFVGLTPEPTPDWRTILVGGLRKGGFGYFALDVTSPGVGTEGQLASKVLWEFPKDSTDATLAKNVGYSYGKPIIVKTRATGWVVIVSSGYNNGITTGGDGKGYLYVLNPLNGDVIATLSTGVGSNTDPSGLGPISAYVDNGEVDPTVEYVYGGDLKGNVWRFDLSASTTASWSVKKLATLVDASNVPQPITAEPELGVIKSSRMVFVGTGKYLGESDIPGRPTATAQASQTQTMYALKDDLSATPEITPLRSSLVQQTISKSGTAATISNNTVDLSTKRGWYIDLPDTGERIFTNPQLALGTLVFTSNIPDGLDACIPGGSSWAWTVNYETGSYVDPANPQPVGISLGNTLASRAVVVKLPSGKVVGLIRKSDATTTGVDVPTGGSAVIGKRVSWREIVQE
ncbi:MAG: pilus assembly protein [Pseudomonadota bacterium]